MAGSSENEECISLSSDNFSPDNKRSNFNKSKKRDLVIKNNGPSSIVISDTELEEGEISDEVEVKKNEGKKIAANRMIREKIIKENKSKVISNINSDTNSTKKKTSEGASISEISINEKYEEPSAAVPESFEWSELRVLMAGDERVVNFNWEEWTDFPVQELYHVAHCNLESLCNLAEKHLFNDYDVVILVGFHYDFVCLNNISNDGVDNNFVLDLKTDVNIIEILKTVYRFHSKWERQYPNTYFIWTLPSPPDFFKYNLFAVREKNFNSEKRIDERTQNELTKNYYALTKKFLKEWKVRNKDIPIFPLSKVLFVKKHCYKRSFEGSGTVKFPRGYLKNGLYPTKMMAMYCAYLLVEYLLAYDFYPENKFGLDIKNAEKKLVEIEPIFKNYLHSSDKSNGHSRRRSSHSSRHYSHRNHKKDGSASPRNSSYRSRSRSRSRRRPKSRQKHTRTRSRSRTRSGSRNRPRSSHSRSNRRSRTKNSSYRRSYSRSRSESNSSESSSSSITETSIELIEKLPETDDSKKIPSKDEMAFFKTLSCLREVHEIHCAAYRKKPQTHPMYKEEKSKFLKRLNSNLPLEFKLPKWEEYWKKRMESILEQTWTVKKDQLTSDLNKKIAFTSLAGYPHNEEGREILATSTPNTDDRDQFKKENVETINSYLKEVESSSISLSSLCQSSSKDFTLAHIFDDVKSNPDSNIRNEISENFVPQGTSNNERHEAPRDDTDENSLCSSDSDLDVDGLMENEDFLQGLEEIDRELQNAVPVENKTTVNTEVVPSTSSSVSLPEDLAFVYNNNTKTIIASSEEDLKSEFVNVLKMLFRVSKRLGPLGLSVSALYHRASEDLKNNDQTFSSLNSDSKSLLILVDKKLSHLLKESLPQVQKAIYGEIAERLQSLLKKMKVEEQDTFSKVNINSIASATVGQQLLEVVSFIKNTLLYHGYSKFTSDDVMNIYMSVKAAQMDMEKS